MRKIGLLTLVLLIISMFLTTGLPVVTHADAPVKDLKKADSSVVVTDTSVITELRKQGVDPVGVELSQDYAMPATINGVRETGKSPYARFYTDLNSDKRFVEFSNLPMVDNLGVKIDPSWVQVGKKFKEKSNLFNVTVNDGSIDLRVRNNQPDGRKEGDTLTYTPQLFLDGQEIPRPFPTLLPVDPLNGNYRNNTLEWDYGICKRWLRLIEGQILGSWMFTSNPGGEIRIRYNQTGDYTLRLGQYAVDTDTELVPSAVFAAAIYPLTVSDSATYYPSLDGYAYQFQLYQTWVDMRNGAGTGANDSLTHWFAIYIGSSDNANLWNWLIRSLILFDTSGLPDTAVISAATISFYGLGKDDPAGWAPNVNIYSSAPASNWALAAGDFDSLGTTAFCDTAITYAGWSTAGYNDFVLNAAGRANISKTGISKFGTRNVNYDVANVAPTWSNTKQSYLQAYSSEQGTGYEPKLVVTYTTPATAPTITLSAATSVAATTATLNGAVTATGGDNPSVTVYWGTTNHPGTSVGWDHSAAPPTSPAQPQGVAAFYHDATSLLPNTTYHFTAKATNSAGTGWPAASLNFATLASAPTTTTSATSSVTSTTAIFNGNVTSTGGENPTVTVYWGLTDGGTTPASWTYNSIPTSPSQPQGAATFYYNAVGLSENTPYYFNAKATNSGGTGWGATQNFATTAAAPTVAMSGPSSVVTTTATLNGAVTATGGDDPTVTVYWGTTNGLTTPGNWDHNAAPTSPAQPQGAAAFYYDATGLTIGVTYYYSARTVNSAGTSWGNPVNFVAGSSPPAVTTSTATNVAGNTATLQGILTSLGGYTVAVYFEYGTTTSYGTPTAQQPMSAPTAFAQDVTGLQPSTTYHFRAAATYNGGLVVNGSDATFTTKSVSTTNPNTPDIIQVPYITGGANGLGQCYAYQSVYETGDALFTIPFHIQYLTTTNAPASVGTAFLGGVHYNGTLIGATEPYAFFNNGTADWFYSIYLTSAQMSAFNAKFGDIIWSHPENFTASICGNPGLTWDSGAVPCATPSSSFSSDSFTLQPVVSQASVTLMVQTLAMAFDTVLNPAIPYHVTSNGVVVLSQTGQAAFVNSIPNLQALAPGVFENSETAMPGTSSMVTVINDYYVAQPANLVEVVYGPNEIAQTFTATADYLIGAVQFYMYSVGSPAALTVNLMGTTGGLPAGSPLVSGLLAGSDIPIQSSGSGTYLYVNFVSLYPIISGTQYAFVLSSPGSDVSNYISLEGSDANDFTGGSVCLSADSGSTWSAVSGTNINFAVSSPQAPSGAFKAQLRGSLDETQFGDPPNSFRNLAARLGVSKGWLTGIVWLLCSILIALAGSEVTRRPQVIVPVTMMLIPFGSLTGFLAMWETIFCGFIYLGAIIYVMFYNKSYT